MTCFPIFLSVVLVVRNQSGELPRILASATAAIAPIVSDYELVIVDNASSDDSVSFLKQLTAQDGMPNLQVYALTKEVDLDTASWVGLESALGDFVAVFDPVADDIAFLPTMINQAVSGADVVFAASRHKPLHSMTYRIGFSVFNALYKWLNDIDLALEAPRYRILSKRVVNFILQHPQPGTTYRHLPATGGFAKANLTYDSAPLVQGKDRLLSGFDRAMSLLVSTTRAPMRVVTALSLLGAAFNLIYSGYVIVVAFLQADVAPGWVTLSLQQSGMFLLISLVLLVLGEYILQMASLSNEGPRYHVAQEFTSAVMTRRENLNIETAKGLIRSGAGSDAAARGTK